MTLFFSLELGAEDKSAQTLEQALSESFKNRDDEIETFRARYIKKTLRRPGKLAQKDEENERSPASKKNKKKKRKKKKRKKKSSADLDGIELDL